MAMNGIDTQLAASRTMELSKDLSSLNRRDALMQDYASLQRKADEELESKTVAALERIDETRIGKEKNNSAHDYREDEKKKKGGTEASEEEEEDAAGIISSGRIDIRI